MPDDYCRIPLTAIAALAVYFTDISGLRLVEGAASGLPICGLLRSHPDCPPTLLPYKMERLEGARAIR